MSDEEDGYVSPLQDNPGQRLALIQAELAAREKEALDAIKGDICEWLSRTLNLNITADSFLDTLDTGVAVCRLATLVQQAARDTESKGRTLKCKVPLKPLSCSSKAESGSFFARDNTSNFIEWCRKLGVEEAVIFESEGLVLHRDEKRVILCLLDVARFADRVGISPPQLVRMEREIDELEANEDREMEDFSPPRTSSEDSHSGLSPPPSHAEQPSPQSTQSPQSTSAGANLVAEHGEDQASKHSPTNTASQKAQRIEPLTPELSSVDITAGVVREIKIDEQHRPEHGEDQAPKHSPTNSASHRSEPLTPELSSVDITASVVREIKIDEQHRPEHSQTDISTTDVVGQVEEEEHQVLFKDLPKPRSPVRSSPQSPTSTTRPSRIPVLAQSKRPPQHRSVHTSSPPRTSHSVVRPRSVSPVATSLQRAKRSRDGSEEPTERESKRQRNDVTGPEEMEPQGRKETVDEKVMRRVNECTCSNKFQVKHCGKGKFIMQGASGRKMTVYARLLSDRVMVRVGGGWDSLDHFLLKHDPLAGKTSGKRKSLKSSLSREQFLHASSQEH